ncbi:MAG: PstS family phosphate ABC transporter substrate-binding protein [Bacteroidota bacterium]
MAKQYVALLVFVGLFITSCGSGGDNGLSGEVKIDGSSTVYPITEAVAEEFRAEAPRVRVTVGVSGTGGGFKKFLRGETDINDASRMIKPSEIEEAKQNDIDYVRLSVAYDGIAVVINPENDWANNLTLDELRKIWEPAAQGKITKWNQIRSEWPDEEIHLFGPGVASGTYDYFTEAIVGESGASRGDYTASEDDNVLVQGVSTDKYAMGFFGIAYYEENMDKLNLIKVENSEGEFIEPTTETVADGSYNPLSRPLFIYVSEYGVQRKSVREFVSFYLKTAPSLAKQVGYVAMPDSVYQTQIKKFEDFLPEMDTQQAEH